MPVPAGASEQAPRARPALAIAIAACAAAAGLSVLLPFAPVFDAWAWLVWGRELAGLELDTSGGPSWKPLPVAITTVLSAAGEAAPELWLAVVRFGWLAATALAWRLAARLVDVPRRWARPAAGAIAAAGVVLLLDPHTPWLRQFAGGLIEPMLVAFVLGAVDRHLSGRDGQALALWAAASLLRPEAWPFAALAALRAWRDAGATARAAVAVAAAAVPALWLVPDLVASGDALTGADRARVREGSPEDAAEAIARAAEMPLAALWAGAALAVASALRRGERAIPSIALGIVAWVGIVAAMAALGYAGLARFLAPSAAASSVLGAVGLARAALAVAAAVRSRAAAVAGAALAALAVLLVAQGAQRAADLPGVADRAAAYAGDVDDLFAVADEIGPERLGACGEVAITDVVVQSAFASKLELPLDRVLVRSRSLPRRGIAVLGREASTWTRALSSAAGTELARRGQWTAYAFSCHSGRRMAGVSGALR